MILRILIHSHPTHLSQVLVHSVHRVHLPQKVLISKSPKDPNILNIQIKRWEKFRMKPKIMKLTKGRPIVLEQLWDKRKHPVSCLIIYMKRWKNYHLSLTLLVLVHWDSKNLCRIHNLIWIIFQIYHVSLNLNQRIKRSRCQIQNPRN